MNWPLEEWLAHRPTCERADVFARWYVVHADVMLRALGTEDVLVADRWTQALDVVADSNGRRQGRSRVR